MAAAMALADTQGVSALSMRTLAESLGVQAMSLYNHVANKDALLDRMVDAVFERVTLPATDDWRAALEARARGMYRELRAHAWAVGLLDSRRSPGATTLAHHDATVGVLRRSGFSPALVAHALGLLDAYVYGFALQEVSMPVDPSDAEAALADALTASSLPPFVNLAWLATARATHAASFEDEFDFGLELVLEGLTRRFEREARTQAPSHLPRTRGGDR